MGVLTAVTNEESNFSIRKIQDGDILDIPENQQMVLCGCLVIEEGGELDLTATNSQVAII